VRVRRAARIKWLQRRATRTCSAAPVFGPSPTPFSPSQGPCKRAPHAKWHARAMPRAASSMPWLVREAEWLQAAARLVRVGLQRGERSGRQPVREPRRDRHRHPPRLEVRGRERRRGRQRQGRRRRRCRRRRRVQAKQPVAAGAVGGPAADAAPAAGAAPVAPAAGAAQQVVQAQQVARGRRRGRRGGRRWRAAGPRCARGSSSTGHSSACLAALLQTTA